MRVPFFSNHLQYEILKKEWDSCVQKVWKSGQYFNGKEVQQLEERLASIGNRKYAVALASCSDALTISAKFFSLPRWAVSPFTFIASASSALRAGSRIHLTSLNPNSYCPRALEYSNSIKTQPDIRGIIHVDLYGSCHSSKEIENFCLKNNLVLIEDAAQSFGGHWNSRPSGSFGNASCLSFDPTKIISGTSAAGALLTDNFELYEFARSIRLHGKNNDGNFSQVGMKSLMSCAEAAIINLKLNYLEHWVERRNEVASLYNSLLQHELIKTPNITNEYQHTFHKYVIKVPLASRPSLREHLSQEGIETRVHYARDLSQEQALLARELTKDNPLQLHKNCEEVLSLPIYPEMSEEQVQHVGHSILRFFNEF